MIQDAPGRYSPQLLSEAYIGMGDSLYRAGNFSGGLQMYQLARAGLRERRTGGGGFTDWAGLHKAR